MEGSVSADRRKEPAGDYPAGAGRRLYRQGEGAHRHLLGAAHVHHRSDGGLAAGVAMLVCTALVLMVTVQPRGLFVSSSRAGNVIEKTQP